MPKQSFGILALILALVILTAITVSGCTVPRDINGLRTLSTSKSWVVTCQGLDGTLSHVIPKTDGKPEQVRVTASLESGEMMLQVEQGETVEILPMPSGTVSIADWADGEVTLRIIGTEAAGIEATFTWS